jgi:hypothetical protein
MQHQLKHSGVMLAVDAQANSPAQILAMRFRIPFQEGIEHPPAPSPLPAGRSVV